MELSFGPEYEDFRQEVRKFAKDYRDRSPKAGAGVSAGPAGLRLKDWQKLLIEKGYAARTIPKQYGGYGAEPDILKAVIAALVIVTVKRSYPLIGARAAA